MEKQTISLFTEPHAADFFGGLTIAIQHTIPKLTVTKQFHFTVTITLFVMKPL